MQNNEAIRPLLQNQYRNTLKDFRTVMMLEGDNQNSRSIVLHCSEKIRLPNVRAPS